MKEIKLHVDDVFNYSKDFLGYCKKESIDISNAKYHHNSSYKDAVSISKHGILSAIDMYNMNIKNYTIKTLNLMSDTSSHVNGNDAISLSVLGLTNLYEGEEEYDPSHPYFVDFLISSDIKAFRSTENYGNEYLSFDPIKIDDIKSIDIRILNLIQTFENRNYNITDINKVIQKLNYLREVCLVLKERKLNIPIREMSFDLNTSVDIDKIANSPILNLKI